MALENKIIWRGAKAEGNKSDQHDKIRLGYSGKHQKF